MTTPFFNIEVVATVDRVGFDSLERFTTLVGFAGQTLIDDIGFVNFMNSYKGNIMGLWRFVKGLAIEKEEDRSVMIIAGNALAGHNQKLNDALTSSIKWHNSINNASTNLPPTNSEPPTEPLLSE